MRWRRRQYKRKSEGKEAKDRGRQPHKGILKASETRGDIRTNNGNNGKNNTSNMFTPHRK